jgi:hypothetical protein
MVAAVRVEGAPGLGWLTYTGRCAGSGAWWTVPGQVVPGRAEVDGVFEPGRERGHGLLRVVMSPVELAIRRLLDPCASRLNSPAAASVAVAIAIGSWSGRIRAASSTRLVYTPASRPVTRCRPRCG